MWKATFVWHVEDMDLYGINFVHHGAPKTWYCVPPQYGHLLEDAVRHLYPRESTSLCTGYMRHKLCLISPEVLDKLGVPTVRVVQEAGEIVIVFPYAYHAGFNHGFNIAESTNFASERWIEYGKRHVPCDCQTKMVRVDMSTFVKRFQKDKYEDWINFRDIEPHPEDPPHVRNRVLARKRDPLNFARRKEEELIPMQTQLCKYVDKAGKQRPVDPMRLRLIMQPATWTEEDEAHFLEWRKAYDDKILIGVYQHISLSHIKINIRLRDSEPVEKLGISFLRKRLGRRHIVKFRDLIDAGEFFCVEKKFILKPGIQKSEDRIKSGPGSGSDSSVEGELRQSSQSNTSTISSQTMAAKVAPETPEDSDNDSYYSESEDANSEHSSEEENAKDESDEYDDPDFMASGAYVKKRRRRKDKKERKGRPKKARRDQGDSVGDNLCKDLAALVQLMNRLRQGQSAELPTQDDKENVPMVIQTNGVPSNGTVKNEEAAQNAKNDPFRIPSGGEPLYFDGQQLVAVGKISSSVLDIAVPILFGLGVITKEVS